MKKLSEQAVRRTIWILVIIIIMLASVLPEMLTRVIYADNLVIKIVKVRPYVVLEDLSNSVITLERDADGNVPVLMIGTDHVLVTNCRFETVVKK